MKGVPYELNINAMLSRSQEGSQYVRGFGGIGGMLRYTVDFQVKVVRFNASFPCKI